MRHKNMVHLNDIIRLVAVRANAWHDAEKNYRLQHDDAAATRARLAANVLDGLLEEFTELRVL